MRTLHLTAMIICHILLSSFILYSTIASGSPVSVEPKQQQHPVEPSKDAVKDQKVQPIQQYAAEQKVEPAQPALYSKHPSALIEKTQTVEKDSLVEKSSAAAAAAAAAQPSSKVDSDSKIAESMEKQQAPKYIDQSSVAKEEMSASAKQEKSAMMVPAEQQVRSMPEIVYSKPISANAARSLPVQESPKSILQAAIPSLDDSVKQKLVAGPGIVAQPEPLVLVQEHPVAPVAAEIKQQPAKEISSIARAAPEISKVQPVSAPEQPAAVSLPLVKGGLGPLHLLAATLCSYQPSKPVSDETLNYLYNQRANQRKNLFQFMSLKFTNLDKLTSHLNAGLEMTKAVDSSESSLVRSHGWPVVGNCTAHYLKLMAEAAWCDCADEPHCVRDTQDVKLLGAPRLARSVSEQLEATSGSVMSKLMHVGDIKEAPVIEGSQKAPATVASTRQCRRNALKLTKALFNHLAENQSEISESWPKLYTELANDECARKRTIDIVTALSTFRGESTQVHRDNIEFAFAMDDLRGKVLENEVNTPLTFDKQVIEVEQFLQQSVRLMLANIDPKRAKLTSMRYRSLHAPVSADDQCIELHQRLLAKNYPDDCNPNQYGPLPDVLRMAAFSLDLWSIEADLAKYSAKVDNSPPKQQDVNECIANLVAN